MNATQIHVYKDTNIHKYANVCAGVYECVWIRVQIKHLKSDSRLLHGFLLFFIFNPRAEIIHTDKIGFIVIPRGKYWN